MPNDKDYERLLAFRTTLRRFDQWSRQAAAANGLTHTQHQLLLAVRGHPGHEDPTVGEIAEYLLVKHHTAGELADRVEALELLRRVRDGVDHRVVRLQLTDSGHHVLAKLTEVHLEELERLSPVLGRH